MIARHSVPLRVDKHHLIDVVSPIDAAALVTNVHVSQTAMAVDAGRQFRVSKNCRSGFSRAVRKINLRRGVRKLTNAGFFPEKIGNTMELIELVKKQKLAYLGHTMRKRGIWRKTLCRYPIPVVKFHENS